jgi:hypothetical protein
MSKWNFDGIYIVAESDGNEVLFSNLHEVARREKQPFSVKMDLTDIPRIGDDGEEVDISRGALISLIGHEIEGSFYTHVANVGCTNDSASQVYALAKANLDIVKDSTENRWSITEGQFRKMIVESIKGPMN